MSVTAAAIGPCSPAPRHVCVISMTSSEQLSDRPVRLSRAGRTECTSIPPKRSGDSLAILCFGFAAARTEPSDVRLFVRASLGAFISQPCSHVVAFLFWYASYVSSCRGPQVLVHLTQVQLS